MRRRRRRRRRSARRPSPSDTSSWREIRRRRPPNETVVEMEKLRLRLTVLREQVGASQVEIAEALGTQSVRRVAGRAE
jgi:hypothetical protein